MRGPLREMGDLRLFWEASYNLPRTPPFPDTRRERVLASRQLAHRLQPVGPFPSVSPAIRPTARSPRRLLLPAC